MGTEDVPIKCLGGLGLVWCSAVRCGRLLGLHGAANVNPDCLYGSSSSSKRGDSYST